jgi:hypothetical protein
MLDQVLIADANDFIEMWKDLKLPDGRDPVVRHSAPSRPGLALSRSAALRYATWATWARTRRLASPRRSYRSGRGRPRASSRPSLDHDLVSGMVNCCSCSDRGYRIVQPCRAAMSQWNKIT